MDYTEDELITLLYHLAEKIDDEGYEFSDTEIFYIPESKVEEYNLI